MVGFRGMSLPLPATAADPYLLELCRRCLQREPAARPTFPQIVTMLDQHYGPTAAWTTPHLPADAALTAPCPATSSSSSRVPVSSRSGSSTGAAAAERRRTLGP